MNIALIGGGNAAVTILNHFRKLKDHAITGIADLKEDAPGMMRAKELGINTTTDMMSLIHENTVNLIIELTGVEKVQNIITENLRGDQHMISSMGALLMNDLIVAEEERNTEVASLVSSRFAELARQLQNAIGIIDKSYEAVKQLVREGNMISINANIQAARAGEAGRPFGIVIDRVLDMVKSIEQAINGISDASQKTHSALSGLDDAKQTLLSSCSDTNKKG